MVRAGQGTRGAGADRLTGTRGAPIGGAASVMAYVRPLGRGRLTRTDGRSVSGRGPRAWPVPSRHVWVGTGGVVVRVRCGVFVRARELSLSVGDVVDKDESCRADPRIDDEEDDETTTMSYVRVC